MKGMVIFYLTILAVLLFLGGMSLTYSEKVGLFPLLVIIPTSILTIMKIIALTNPAIARRLDPGGILESQSIKKIKEGMKEIDPELEKPVVEKPRSMMREVLVILWASGFTFGIYLFGFLVTIPVFTFLFIKIYGKRSTGLSLAVSAILVGSVYLLFSIALKIELYRGLLF